MLSWETEQGSTRGLHSPIFAYMEFGAGTFHDPTGWSSLISRCHGKIARYHGKIYGNISLNSVRYSGKIARYSGKIYGNISKKIKIFEKKYWPRGHIPAGAFFFTENCVF